MIQIKESLKKYGKKQMICGILGTCIALVLTGFLVDRRMERVEAKMAETQETLAGEVFRFHVLANSDSEEDQNVKLKVRDAVLQYMKEDMSQESAEMDVEHTRQWAREHLKEIEAVADRVIRDEGYSYQAQAEVTSCYFPDKKYGDILLPEGEYEALRVKLGRASGHNWWCVLYPNLCFTNATCAVVDDEGKQKLKSALSAEEYEMVTATTDFKIKWFFFGDDDEEP